MGSVCGRSLVTCFSEPVIRRARISTWVDSAKAVGRAALGPTVSLFNSSERRLLLSTRLIPSFYVKIGTMNILLWVLQVLLAAHTVIGAVWKFTSPEQNVPSLSAIPHAAWLGLSTIEIVCALGLVLPGLHKPLARWVPWAAGVVAAEMALFCFLHLQSGAAEHEPLIYWAVVAAVCMFIAYGRSRKNARA